MMGRYPLTNIEAHSTDKANLAMQTKTVSKKKKKIKSLPLCDIDKLQDRKLQGIATKGVVNLFNAVLKQKKIIDNQLAEAKGLNFKEEKILKSVSLGSFLDILKEKDNLDSKSNENLSSNNSKMPVWDALKDTMQYQSKDWDKNDNNLDHMNCVF